MIGAALDDIAAVCGCSLATVKRRLAVTELAIADHVRATRRLSGSPDSAPRTRVPAP